MALISMNFDKMCTATIPTVVEVFAAMTPLGYVFISIATLLSLFTCLIFMDELYFIHVKVPYKSHKERLYWLIGIFPVFSMTSLLGIYVPRSGVLVDFVASVYLSISVFQFFQLIVEYFGGKSCMLEILSHTPIPLQSPPLACCCPCLPKVQLTKKNFTRLKAIVFQTAVVRPLLIFIASVLWTDGSYTPGQLDLANAYLYLTIMTSISTIIGMYGLVIMFRIAKNHLKEHHLLAKFISIQLVLIFSNLQSSILDLLTTKDILPCVAPFYTKTRGLELNHLLLVMECFILSVLLHHYYRKEALNRRGLENGRDNDNNNTNYSRNNSNPLHHRGSTPAVPSEPPASTIRDIFMTPARKLTLVSVIMAHGHHNNGGKGVRSPAVQDYYSNVGRNRTQSAYTIDNHRCDIQASPKIYAIPAVCAASDRVELGDGDEGRLKRTPSKPETEPHHKTQLLKGYRLTERTKGSKFRRKSAGAALPTTAKNKNGHCPAILNIQPPSSSSPDSSNEYSSLKMGSPHHHPSPVIGVRESIDEVSMDGSSGVEHVNVTRRDGKTYVDVGVQYDNLPLASYKPEF